jgi:hypothetical protein
MKRHLRSYRSALLAAGLLLAAWPALSLEINNNSGYALDVTVTCGEKKASGQVGISQVWDCPSNVCSLGADCRYSIKAEGDGRCRGAINGGSGLQVGSSDGELSCQPR